MSETTIWAAMGATAATASALTGLTVHVINKVAEARRRPEADWIVRFWAWRLEEDPHNPDDFVPETIAFRGEVMNCGDAKAFSVTVVPSSGTLSLSTPLGHDSPTGIGAVYHDAFALLDPGDKFDFRGSMHESQWAEATIVIDWITSPTRLKKHLQYSLKCSERVPSPGGLYDDAE